LRQFSSCYAIRAGRNSPDKEFRYLRTIIVIAGVHQRFGSKLRTLRLRSAKSIKSIKLKVYKVKGILSDDFMDFIDFIDF